VFRGGVSGEVQWGRLYHDLLAREGDGGLVLTVVITSPRRDTAWTRHMGSRHRWMGDGMSWHIHLNQRNNTTVVLFYTHLNPNEPTPTMPSSDILISILSGEGWVDGLAPVPRLWKRDVLEMGGQSHRVVMPWIVAAGGEGWVDGPCRGLSRLVVRVE